MAWVRKDDRETEHPKILALIGQAGYEAYYRRDCLIEWCARNGTGGHFTAGTAHVLGVTPKHLQAMQAVGLVDANGEGLEIHDFGVYNPPNTNAARQRRYRDRKRNEGPT